MASPKVHCTKREAGGNKVTVCGRLNPPHSTVSIDWVTCKLCLEKLEEASRAIGRVAHRW